MISFSVLPSVKNLHLFFLSLLLMASSVLFAQKPKVQNLKTFDQRWVHFGFSLGLNSANFTVDRKAPDFSQDSLLRVDVVSQGGFNLGLVSDLHLSHAFSLRFVPALVFGQRNMEYRFQSDDGSIQIRQLPVESTYIDFPLLFKYRSQRLNNFAAYLIAGGKYSIDLASNEKVLNEDIDEPIVKIMRNTTSAEVGVGTDFFLQYFKFSLELKMSYGLQNVLVKDGTLLTDPIDRILPKMFFLTLHFEG